MNKLLLEVVKFTELPPRTRRVAGLGHVPVPELVEPHSDGGGESVTHHIKFVSDDGNTEVIHKVTQHVRRDGKPYIIPNTIRTDVYHKGTMSKKIHPMPEDEEGRQKRNLQIRGDIRTAIGVTRHIRNVIPELAKKYNAKEWRISASDPNSNVQQGRKASTYERVVGMIAKKHGARKRFLGVPLPGRVKPKKVTSTLISLKLAEQKNILYSAIQHIRESKEWVEDPRPGPKIVGGTEVHDIPNEIRPHKDNKGHDAIFRHVYRDGETQAIHIITRPRRDDGEEKPTRGETMFFHKGTSAVPSIKVDPNKPEEAHHQRRENAKVAMRIKAHMEKTIPQLAAKYGATHWSGLAFDSNKDAAKRKSKIYALGLKKIVRNYGKGRMLGLLPPKININPKYDTFHVELSPRKLKRIKDE